MFIFYLQDKETKIGYFKILFRFTFAYLKYSEKKYFYKWSGRYIYVCLLSQADRIHINLLILFFPSVLPV